eukprot:s13_g28.t1
MVSVDTLGVAKEVRSCRETAPFAPRRWCVGGGAEDQQALEWWLCARQWWNVSFRQQPPGTTWASRFRTLRNQVPVFSSH